MQRKKYEPEFKIRVVKESIQVGNGAAVARRYDIHPSMANRWVRKYKEHGGSAFEAGRNGKAKTNGSRDPDELEHENEKLKKLLGEKDLEIAILRDLVKKGSQH